MRTSGRTIDERFFAKVYMTSDCWVWTAGKMNGYGCFWPSGRKWVPGRRSAYKRAHVYMYEQVVGPVPEGLELDHLCRNRSCVRPDHLEAVTHTENVRRACRVEVCKYGHAFTPENTYISPKRKNRQCKICIKVRSKANADRLRSGPVPEDAHGTLRGYATYHCRCVPCKEASAAYLRERKARRLKEDASVGGNP